MARHVRKGDKVMIISGSHKGKTGTIMRVITKSDRVVITGLNLRTKHLKPTRLSPQGGIVTREAPIHMSNVMPVDSSGKPTRVRFETKPDGSKVRLAVTTGEQLGEPIRGAEAKKDVQKAAPAKAAPGRKPAAKKVSKKTTA